MGQAWASVGRGQRGRLAPSGFYNRKFLSLAAKDHTFVAYLEKNGLVRETMDSLPEFQKAALVRKILSTVVIRDEFLFERGEQSKGVGERPAPRARRFRARKRVPRIYTGAHSLFGICEGNPRWIIGLLRPLIADFAYSTDGLHSRSIGRALQAQRIERTITTFIILLSTLRVDDPSDGSISIIEFIELLGDFCFEQVLAKQFNPEPILSFTIDGQVSPSVINAVGRAINQGGLVLIPKRMGSPKEQRIPATGPGGIQGRRVRLTFLLAPRYRLPLVLGRSVDLSSVLRAHKRPKAGEEQLILADLFSALP
jgi:hypothetical protein